VVEGGSSRDSEPPLQHQQQMHMHMHAHAPAAPPYQLPGSSGGGALGRPMPATARQAAGGLQAPGPPAASAASGSGRQPASSLPASGAPADHLSAELAASKRSNTQLQQAVLQLQQELSSSR
jgi:hypothetical protein